MKNLLLLIPAFCVSLNVVAQNNGWCGTDEAVQRLIDQNPQYLQDQADARQVLQGLASNGSASRVLHTIPVVVHVIHDNGVGNISHDQILDGIRIRIEEDRNRSSAFRRDGQLD